MNYWITTHWPSPEPDGSSERHVYFKTGKRTVVPRPGDVVYVYESAYAVVDGKAVTAMHHTHNGQRRVEKVPPGRCALVARLVVAEEARPIRASDAIRDYGDAEKWSIIRCIRQKAMKPLSKADLMELLGHPRETPPRFLSLYKIKDENVVRRLEALVENYE